MPTLIGSLNANATPILNISVYGISSQYAKDFEAIIDTGSTNFLSMPLFEALPLGLILFGTTNITFADGSSSWRLTAWGHIAVGGETRSGVFVLHPNSQEVLLGMEFLKMFSKALTVDPINQVVTLVDVTAAASMSAASPS